MGRRMVRFESTAPNAAQKAAETAKESASKASSSASDLASKATQGLSRVTSAAGPALAGAAKGLGAALTKLGGRSARLVAFVERKPKACPKYPARLLCLIPTLRPHFHSLVAWPCRSACTVAFPDNAVVCCDDSSGLEESRPG